MTCGRHFLALLCRWHHRAVLEGGYQVERLTDGTLRFRRPDGRLLPDVPPPVALPADPVQVLRARHEMRGLRLHARTACPLWLGERLDLGWAIDVLHPLATRGAGGNGNRSASTGPDHVELLTLPQGKGTGLRAATALGI